MAKRSTYDWRPVIDRQQVCADSYGGLIPFSSPTTAKSDYKLRKATEWA